MFVPLPLFNISLSGIFLQKVPRKPICQDFILIEEPRCYAIFATQMYVCNTRAYLQHKCIFAAQRYVFKFTYLIEKEKKKIIKKTKIQIRKKKKEKDGIKRVLVYKEVI